MRVLWITNILPPAFAAHLGIRPSARGGWVPALADALSQSNSVELGVAVTVSGGEWVRQRLGDVEYYAVPLQGQPLTSPTLMPAFVRSILRVVAAFRPDVVHIHGTEYIHGLLSGLGHVSVPSVISIQGIINAYERHFLADLSQQELRDHRTLRDLIRHDSLAIQHRRMRAQARTEKQVFALNRDFIGRTEWDRAHVLQLNPNARYHSADELLRPPFWSSRWTLDHCRRHTIFASSASEPLKGFHVLLKAVAILKADFPDISVRCPLARFPIAVTGIRRAWLRARSPGYQTYLMDLVTRLGIGNHVKPMGMLDAGAMADELRQAHVFALPSFIENSPNSLAEAMLVGTPSVAAYVGGVPSMVQDDQTALCFPPGDEALLAEAIRRVFLDDSLAQRLSRAAHVTASVRHSPNRAISQYLAIYQDIRSSNLALAPSTA